MTNNPANSCQPDPGLQPERTRLAWTRTALGQLACAALVLHTAIPDHDLAATVFAAPALIAATLAFVVIQSPRSNPSAPQAPHWAFAGISAGTATCAVSALLLVTGGSPS